MKGLRRKWEDLREEEQIAMLGRSTREMPILRRFKRKLLGLAERKITAEDAERFVNNWRNKYTNKPIVLPEEYWEKPGKEVV